MVTESSTALPAKDQKHNNAQTTLVKYENPILIRDKTGKKNIMRPMTERPMSPGFPQKPNIPGLIGSSTGGHDPVFNRKDMDDILQVVFPPIEWEEDDKVWQQTVSSLPATRNDVAGLEEKLDIRLHQQQVRVKGISPIRHDLYLQCFDELIRQVTIDCAERGLLLLRIRDEIRMTIAAYQAITISSIRAGQSAAIEADQLIAGLDASIQEASADRTNADWQAQDLSLRIELLERQHHDKKKAEDRRHVEEMKLLKLASQQLQSQLDNILAFNKKP